MGHHRVYPLHFLCLERGVEQWQGAQVVDLAQVRLADSPGTLGLLSLTNKAQI